MSKPKPKPKAAAAPLLVELLTEELPPKSLPRLSGVFAAELVRLLHEAGFIATTENFRPYATPRRLAVLIDAVLARQADRTVERRGPAIKSALDGDGRPTPALLGFAKSCGVNIDKLTRRSGDKGEYFVFLAAQKGEALKHHLAAMIEAALKKIPAPKLMRWGDSDFEFVRPVHGVVMLHGTAVVPGTVLGVKSGNKTMGHRFLSHGKLAIGGAARYAQALQKAYVIADFDVRRQTIVTQLATASRRIAKHEIEASDALVAEVASIVEYPAVYAGAFSPEFLEVPSECLAVSMQQHQKYFPLYDRHGRLLPKFLFVSNIKTNRPEQIIGGNERVLKARLADAKFFYEQDRKMPLAVRVTKLGHVVYHNKLGTQLQRVQRLERLAGAIAARMQLSPAEIAAAQRTAHLAKADLLTDMVGEFPELQGTMGKYYARHDGEAADVAEAIEQHYFPKGSGGALPSGAIAQCVALADKLDTLVGIYGAGLIPTGDKDPFGLRRQALGVIRILAEQALPLDLLDLLGYARAEFSGVALSDDVVADLHVFMLERLKPYLRDQGFKPDEIDAVLSMTPSRIDQVLPRLRALQSFRDLPDAQALAAANKRIHNILRQAGDEAPTSFDEALLRDAAERDLLGHVQENERTLRPLIARGDYTAALKALARLRGAVDRLFDEVMVMADDVALKRARLGLLARLRALFLEVADISKLQP